MSANLLDGVKPEITQYGSMTDGVITSSTPKDGWNNAANWPITSGKFAENQTMHLGISAKWHGKAATTGVAYAAVKYADAAGSINNADIPISGITTEWKRFSLSAVIPSGMHIVDFHISGNKLDAAYDATNPVLSYGSPVTLASSAHTPYATQDHVSVTYATKASLKVTDDSVKAEVSARAQTDRNVADLSSRLTQTANSLTSEISDRKTAITTVTGLANAAQSTADNAAKQANLYTIGLGDAGAVAKWIHLGTLTSAGNASSATISIVFGDGYNGSASQNSKLTITIKDGFQNSGSATKACGVTAMRENCDNALVDVLAQSAIVYDVWVYAPWAYSNGRYSISGQYAAWQHSGATQKAEPATSATQVKQDVAYRLADATKAQTMATENQSSIKQLSTSITAEVTARTKTDRLVSEVSSRLTQTANSLTTEISDRRSAITTVTGLANAAQSTANAAKSTVDGMKLGGRNLLKGTSMDVVTGAYPSSSYKDYLSYTTIDVADGDTYTLSFDAKSTHDGDILFCYFYSPSTTLTGVSSTGMKFDSGSHRDGYLQVKLTADWQRYWCTWTQSATAKQKTVIPFRCQSGVGTGTVSMRGVKLEAGNKATDWTPAPEDTDSAVADAKKAGTDAQSSANAAKTMATENQSSIKQLSNSITSEVTQRTKTDQMVSDLSSRLTQTADGFNASIDRLSDTDRKVNSWFGFDSDSSGNPQLTMGSSTSPVVGVYTNTGLAYKARSGATLLELDGASRSSTMPHVHADDVSIGSWQWTPTQNGTHFTLQWIGG